jgi:hypothetical protein
MAHPPEENGETGNTKGIEIFRRADARTLTDSGAMSYEHVDGDTLARLSAALGPEQAEGAQSLTLFQGGGMSLVKVWFKSNYPLARHAHNAPCLYYIIAGSLFLGRQELLPGEGFLVRPNVLYTYTAGPDGVELLEFRSSETFDIQVPASSESYWTRLRSKMLEAHDGGWKGEVPPSGRT